ncbi:MAG TPA: DUF4199 domain-containing protein [Mucilaginibacter sp.]|nr:DUF4199 domain-containing protein [Mucilaginibacter sp.]
MENLDKQIRKIGFNNGIILGVITLALGIFSFYFMTQMTTSFWMVVLVGPVLFSLIVPIVIVIFYCIDFRKKIGGFWTFKQALTGIFIMLLVAYVISAIGNNLIFAKLIEPNMVEKMQNSIINSTRSFMEQSGTDQSTIDSKIVDMQKTFDDQKNMTVGKTIMRQCIALVVIFILALIFAAIFKRNPLKDIGLPPDPAV